MKFKIKPISSLKQNCSHIQDDDVLCSDFERRTRLDRIQPECRLCKYNPKYHSFNVISETDNITYYHTYPSNGKDYTDIDNIISHIRIELSQLKRTQEWIWIIDCSGLRFKHLYSYKVGIEILDFISKYYTDNLCKIIILKPNTYFKLIYRIIKSFVSNKILSKILYDYKNSFNNLLLLCM